MMSTKAIRVLLLAVTSIQFWGCCVTLKLGDKGVCQKSTLTEMPAHGRYHYLLADKKRNVCCQNYEYESDLDKCQPICRMGCLNGDCVDVDKCECKPPLTLVNNACVQPVCSRCEHGDCVAPGDCRCHAGYVKLDGTCAPVCDFVCVNGQCSEPNKCKCNPGYTQDPNNVFKCNPTCDPQCVNGTCASHNKCICSVGYEPTADSSVCRPTCAGCEHGECIAPNQCICSDGYERMNSTCKPRCSSNGDCIAPESGLVKADNVLLCSPPCNNRTCLTATQCYCNPGFLLTCSVTCTHGYCSPPTNCRCIPK